MRNIRKKLNVKEVVALVYDTSSKTEKTIKGTVSQVELELEIPEGCVFISEEVVSEKEVTYKMTPQEFVKHAIIEE